MQKIKKALKLGGSIAVLLPKTFTDITKIKPKDKLNISLKNNKQITIEKGLQQ